MSEENEVSYTWVLQIIFGWIGPISVAFYCPSVAAKLLKAMPKVTVGITS